MPILRKYGVECKIKLAIVGVTSANYAVGSDWDPAEGDVKIVKDEGSEANTTNLPTYVGAMTWTLTLTATEMSAASVVIGVSDQTTPAAIEEQVEHIDTYGHASAQHELDLDSAMRGTDSAALASICTEARLAELDAGNLPAINSSINSMVSSVFTAIGAFLDAPVSSRATPVQVNAEVDAALDTAIPGSPTADSINERIKTLDDKATAVVAGAFTGSPTTVSGNTDLSGYAADVFVDRYIYITSGAFRGEFAKIIDYTVTNGVVSFEALSGAPVATDTFVIA